MGQGLSCACLSDQEQWSQSQPQHWPEGFQRLECIDQICAIAETIQRARLKDAMYHQAVTPHILELKGLAQPWCLLAPEGLTVLKGGPLLNAGASLTALVDRLDRTKARLLRLLCRSSFLASERKVATKLNYLLMDTYHAHNVFLADFKAALALCSKPASQRSIRASGDGVVVLDADQGAAARAQPRTLPPPQATQPAALPVVQNTAHRLEAQPVPAHEPQAAPQQVAQPSQPPAASDSQTVISQQTEQRAVHDGVGATAASASPRTGGGEGARDAATGTEVGGEGGIQQYMLLLSAQSPGAPTNQLQGVLVPLSPTQPVIAQGAVQASTQPASSPGSRSPPSVPPQQAPQSVPPPATTLTLQLSPTMSPAAARHRPRDTRSALAVSAEALGNLLARLNTPIPELHGQQSGSAQGFLSQPVSPTHHQGAQGQQGYLFLSPTHSMAHSQHPNRLASRNTDQRSVSPGVQSQSAWLLLDQQSPTHHSAPVATALADEAEAASAPGIPPLLMEAAQSGDPHACAKVATLYEAAARQCAAFDAQACQALYADAAQWHTRAMHGGVVASATALGYLLEMELVGHLGQTGSNLGQSDPTTAAQLYAWAALRGCATATNNLARMLAEGKGLAQDKAAAERLLERAAEWGSADAAYNLAALTGSHGVRSDQLDESNDPQMHLLQQASRAGHTAAALRLSKELLSQSRVGQAILELVHAGKAGCAPAATLAAQLLEDTATRLSSKAAGADGNTIDPLLVSLLSDLQTLVPDSSSHAAAAATQQVSPGSRGHESAQRTASLRALQAGLTQAERAHLVATRWYHHAAMAGDPQAQHWLGNALWDSGQEQEATQWWSQGAAQDWAPSLMMMGRALEQSAVEWSATPGQEATARHQLSTALEHYRRAAEQGFQGAQEQADRLCHVLSSGRNTGDVHQQDQQEACNLSNTAGGPGVATWRVTEGPQRPWTAPSLNRTAAAGMHNMLSQSFSKHTGLRTAAAVEARGLGFPRTVVASFSEHSSPAKESVRRAADAARARVMMYAPPSLKGKHAALASPVRQHGPAAIRASTLPASMRFDGTGEAASRRSWQRTHPALAPVQATGQLDPRAVLQSQLTASLARAAPPSWRNASFSTASSTARSSRPLHAAHHLSFTAPSALQPHAAGMDSMQRDAWLSGRLQTALSEVPGSSQVVWEVDRGKGSTRAGLPLPLGLHGLAL